MKDKAGFLKSMGFVRLKDLKTAWHNFSRLSAVYYNTVQFVGVIFQIIVAIGRKNETICYGIQTAWEYYSLLIDKLCIKNYWKY